MQEGRGPEEPTCNPRYCPVRRGLMHRLIV